MKTNKSGISLIVLVITIIVMIILASAIIITLSSNGIIGKANTAVDDMNEAQIKEVITLAWSEAQLKVTQDEKTDDWYYSTISQYLKDNGYTGDATDAIIGVTGIVPSPSLLKDQYEYYYNSLSSAIADVNAGTVGTNANADKDSAVAGISVENGQNIVALFKDTTEPSITITEDVTLNLGGCTLTSNDIALIINDADANVIIDGRIKGSTVSSATAVKSFALQLRTGEATIKGGTYLATATDDSTSSVTSYASVMMSQGKLNIQDATLKAEHFGIGGRARGIETKTGAITSVTNSAITAISKSGVAICFYNNGKTTSLVDCNIRAYSDYGIVNEERVSSQGIANYGDMYLENCYVMGTHSGVQTAGTLVVNKGTYEGYSHGGIYFSGANKTHYAQNATIRWCPMPEGYGLPDYGGSISSGMYIGGESGMNNIKVYMDNCDVSAEKQAIVIRGTSGEENNTLYISNSRLDLSKKAKIRIDEGYNHKVYIGTGCNFTADNTDLPSAVITTTETYTKP